MTVIRERLSRFRVLRGGWRLARRAIYSLHRARASAAHLISHVGLPRPRKLNIHGVEILVHPRAIQDFRMFTDRDTQMIEEMASFIELTRHARCLLDVGAYAGIFSLVFTSQRRRTAVAVEPNGRMFWVLRYHVKVNQPCAIRCHRVALGRSESTLLMREQFGHLVASSTASRRDREVRMTTLDRLLQDQAVLPDVVKIDVEGYELEVLRGGAAYLRARQPILFLELHPPELKEFGRSIDDVFAFLKGLGYSFFDTAKRPLHEQALPDHLYGNRATRVICISSED